MEDSLSILLVAGGMLFSILVLVIVTLIILVNQGTKSGDGGSGGVTPLGSGTPLPLEGWPFTKNREPWYISQYDTNIKLVNTSLRFPLSKNATGHSSGAGFKANPLKLFPTTGVELSYRVYFPEGFDWSKGGKLPGVCWGTQSNDCATGSEWSTTAGSFRVMWRESGQAIGYAYLALTHKASDAGNKAMQMNQGTDFTKAVRLNQTNKAGLDIWHKHGKKLQLKTGWNTVLMQLKMNDPKGANDEIHLTINGVTNSVKDASLRSDESVKFNMVNIVVFRGGSGSDWESDRDSYVDLDSFKIRRL